MVFRPRCTWVGTVRGRFSVVLYFRPRCTWVGTVRGRYSVVLYFRPRCTWVGMVRGWYSAVKSSWPRWSPFPCRWTASPVVCVPLLSISNSVTKPMWSQNQRGGAPFPLQMSKYISQYILNITIKIFGRNMFLFLCHLWYILELRDHFVHSPASC